MATVVAGSMMLGCMMGCGFVPVRQVIIEEGCGECSGCGEAACTPLRPLCARPRVCRGCGWSAGGGGQEGGVAEGGVAEEATFYVHPRFHPVPTEPAFHRVPVEPPLGVIPGPFNPQALPEELHTPAPEPKVDDSTTSIPKQLDLTGERPSWVFNHSDTDHLRKAQSSASNRRLR